MKKIVMIIENFDLAIDAIINSDLPKLDKIKEKISIATEFLFQTRVVLRNTDSISKKDEIRFFKHQKPYVRGKLNFYVELKNYHTKYPATGISRQKKYINKQIVKLEVKKRKIFEFTKYCMLNATKFDHIYFLRAHYQMDLFMNNDLDDLEFSTSHDLLATQIITYNLLMKFYMEELALLKTNKSNVVIKEVRPAILNNLKWYGSITNYVEFINGVDAQGVFGTPTPDSLKNLIQVSEYLFNINLGTHQKTFNEIKARTKDPTRFMDSMTAALNDRIRFGQEL
ncbi:MAG: RteC domain-containing protein [Lutibacter sp.]|nr:RteC domain-containing protein [Lutibacter sp.]